MMTTKNDGRRLWMAFCLFSAALPAAVYGEIRTAADAPFWVKGVEDKPFRLTGLTIDGAGCEAPLGSFPLEIGGDCKSFRVDHCNLKDAIAATPIRLDLWPGKPPGDVGIEGGERARMVESPLLDKPTKVITNVSRPTLVVYPASKQTNTGTAMIICPGGGYHDLFWELEGEEVAAWLNAQGMTGILLKYRVPRRPGDIKGEPPLGPLIDAQRAVSLARRRCQEWGVDPKRIGIVGFSAGGHLAVATAANFNRRRYEPVDNTDKESCRPDFAVGCYSGYFKAKDNDSLSPAAHITPIPSGMPPVLLAHASDDTISDPEHSVMMYLALKRAGAPAELHMFSSGEHDFGVRRNDKLPSIWPKLCLRWLRGLTLLEPAPLSARP